MDSFCGVDVVSVEPLEPRLLRLVFSDGCRATVDLDGIVVDYCGVFAPLLAPSFFRRVAVSRDLGTVVWPNGADIAPETLRAAAAPPALPPSK